MTGLGYAVDALAAWLSGSSTPGWFAVLVAILVVWVVPVLLVVFPVAAVGQIIERKVAAEIIRRAGEAGAEEAVTPGSEAQRSTRRSP